jgi:homocysteine S-methyltransferase
MDGAMGNGTLPQRRLHQPLLRRGELADPKLRRVDPPRLCRGRGRRIETNTFGANRHSFKAHGLEAQVAAINEAGARIAREAADGRAYVAGAVGPLGIRLEPWGKTSLDEAFEAFREQAKALLTGGVDLFVLETFCDLSELHQAIRAVRDLTDLPLIAQLTVREDGHTVFGTPPEVFVKRLDTWPADAIGVNCAGPQVALETLEDARAGAARCAAERRHARSVENRASMASPEYMAEHAAAHPDRRLVIGGAAAPRRSRRRRCAPCAPRPGGRDPASSSPSRSRRGRRDAACPIERSRSRRRSLPAASPCRSN